MKEQFEQMSLEELGETLREGLAILQTKLCENLGYEDSNVILGTLDSKKQPDVCVINTSKVKGASTVDLKRYLNYNIK